MVEATTNSRRAAKRLAHLTRRVATTTLAVSALLLTADAFGAFAPLERWLYDARARHCQYFDEQPTDRLVHLDIDDSALETIGAWPWPRTVMADVADDLPQRLGPRIR